MHLLPSLLLVTLFTVNCFAQSKVVFKGNTFIMSGTGIAEIYDPVSGGTDTERTPSVPLNVNGEKIYDASSLMTLPSVTNNKGMSVKLSTYIFDSLKTELQQLEDGEYVIDIQSPVISKEGKLVYYKMNGIKQLTHQPMATTTTTNEKGNPVTYTRMNNVTDDKTIPIALKKKINQKVTDLLEHLPPIKPGTISNKPVNATGELFHSGSEIKVINHTASFSPAYFTL